MGRPTKFSQKLADTICVSLADGESLRTICSQSAMPARSTVFRWLEESEAFRDQYTRAREASAEADADDVGHYARQAARGEIEPAAARAAIDGLKWAAGKRAPKKYGDKIDLTSSDGSMSPKPTVIEFVAPDAGED